MSGIFDDVRQYVGNASSGAYDTAAGVGESITNQFDDEKGGGFADAPFEQYARERNDKVQETNRKINEYEEERRQADSHIGRAIADAKKFDAKVKLGTDFLFDNPTVSAQDTVRGTATAAPKAAYNSLNEGLLFEGDDIESPEDIAEGLGNAYSGTKGIYDETTQYIGDATEGTALDNRGTDIAVGVGEFAGGVVLETGNNVLKASTGLDAIEGEADADVGSIDVFDAFTVGAGTGVKTAAKGATKMGLGSLLKAGTKASDDIFARSADDLAEASARSSDDLASGGDDLASQIENTRLDFQSAFLSGGDEAASTVDNSLDDASSLFARSTDDTTRVADETTGAADDGLDDVIQQYKTQASSTGDDLVSSGADDLSSSVDDFFSTGSKAGTYTALGGGALGGIALGGTVTSMFGGGGNSNPADYDNGNSPSSHPAMEVALELEEATIYRIYEQGSDPATAGTAGFAVYVGQQNGSLYVIDSSASITKASVSLSQLESGVPFRARFTSLDAAKESYYEALRKAKGEGDGSQNPEPTDDSDVGWGEAEAVKQFDTGAILVRQTRTSGSGTRFAVLIQEGQSVRYINADGRPQSDKKFYETREAATTAHNKYASQNSRWGDVEHIRPLGEYWHLFRQDKSDGSSSRYIVAGQTEGGSTLYLQKNGSAGSEPEYYSSLDAVGSALEKFYSKEQAGEHGSTKPSPTAGAPSPTDVENDSAKKDEGDSLGSGSNKKALIGGIAALGYLYYKNR